MKLKELPETYAVSRLSPRDPLPGWATEQSNGLRSATWTPDELSIVCEESRVPAAVKAERGWCCLEVEGPLDFSLTGIMASLTRPLAEAGISVFALSTFDTDYLLVKRERLAEAKRALHGGGHHILPAIGLSGRHLFVEAKGQS